MELARALKDEGCCCDPTLVKPVPIRFLGLYDPVDMAWGVGGGDTVPENVQHAYAVYPRPEAETREFFRRARQGPEDSTVTTYNETEVLASHAGIGGAPWDNRGFQDRWGAIISDQMMRQAARDAGINIKQIFSSDYGYELKKWAGQ